MTNQELFKKHFGKPIEKGVWEGNLYLRHYALPLPVGLTGYNFKNFMLSWGDKYIKADGIFTEVISRKGNIYKVRKIGSEKVFWLVSDGELMHAHGDTLQKANADLEFKIMSEKLKKEPIEKDTMFTVKYYRLLTGACDIGCRSWLDANNIGYTLLNKGTDEEETVDDVAMRADDLLPLLEKSNAYGIEKIKSLLNW